MRRASVIGRIAAIAAILVACVVVAIIVFGSGGSTYTVYADFINASQIVKGNQVQLAGSPVGTINDITLTPNGEARLKLQIDSAHAPLRQGTHVVIRQASLSGEANRYVDLRMPPGEPPKIPNGATIPESFTTSAVDLDQIFNIFGPRQRKALQQLIQGSASQFQGQGANAQVGFAYLNPAIATSSVLFRELDRDTPQLTRFIVDSGKLASDIAQRQSDLSGLVAHLSTTTGAIATQRPALASALQQLPPFMRRADTTFVNLRSTLDYLHPLIEHSKPVAIKLQPFLRQLRPLALDARPTVHDLTRLVHLPGPQNDLIELTGDTIPLAKITVGKVRANGKVREGAFPATTRALAGGTPELAEARPYAVDLTGWFDDFSHSGVYDALGGASRVAINIGTASQQLATPALVNPILNLLAGKGLGGVASGAGGAPTLTTGQTQRCPGSMERGALYYPYQGYPCNPSEVPTGK